jgi:peroxiredoxin Q/BCP
MWKSGLQCRVNDETNRTSMPDVGSAAPDFNLTSQEGSSVSLSDYRGRWVVLYFYPKDQTPG